MKHVRILLLIASPLVVVIIAVLFLTKNRDPDGGKVSVHHGPPLTEAECQAYGHEVEAAVTAGDAARVNQLFRFDELAERVLISMRVSAKAHELLMSVTKKKSSELGDAYTKGVADGGRFSYLRMRGGAGVPTVLFRLVNPGGGFTYVEVTPARHPDGTIVAADIYATALGESLTQSLRRLFTKLAAKVDAGLLPKLSRIERLHYDNAGKVQAIMLALKEGRSKDAYDVYQQLPAELRKEKNLQLMAIVAVQEAGGAAYLQVLESFRKDYPADPAMDLFSYDYFLLRKEYKNAHESLDRLDQLIGGDPYISLPRGRLLVEEGRYADAKAEYEKAIAQCPGYADILWARITLATIEKNHDDTLAWFKEAVVQCGMAIDEPSLRGFDTLVPFLKSAQYQQLLKWQQERGK